METDVKFAFAPQKRIHHILSELDAKRKQRGGQMAVNEYVKVWNARKWLKEAEPFLKVWHAYLGYSLNLFSYFKNGAKVADVADKHGLKAELLSRWVEVGVAVGHLRESKGGKIKTKPKMGKYLTKESKHSVGILLEELFELHMPTLLSYREQLPNKKQEPPPDMADMVAGTSSLLEALAVPKIAAVIKKRKAESVLDVGCGYGGYLKRLAHTFPWTQFDGIEVDHDVCISARENNLNENVTIIEGDFFHFQGKRAYDVLMFNNILYYFSPETRVEMFKRAAEQLATDGVLIVISPITDGKHGKRFASAFNSFMSAHKKMHPLPSKKELVKAGKHAHFRLLSAKTVVKEGGWHFLLFEQRGKH